MDFNSIVLLGMSVPEMLSDTATATNCVLVSSTGSGSDEGQER